MASLSIPALRCGGPANLPHSTVLRAGPLSMLLEQGELRRIRLGNREVIRRIYVGLRGPDWATIPGALSDLSVQVVAADSFMASYTLTHKHAEYDFTWKISLSGSADGSVRFQAHGKAASAFATNRAALCVLHPLRECLGRPVRLAGADGKIRKGRFPELIEPQQPFLDFQDFEYELEPGLWIALQYTGDTFEMEDQRNWSDGSFKTYCPPQARPKPMKVEAGWETLQTVTLELHGGPPAAEPVPERIVLWPVAGAGKPVPAWGFGAASHGALPGPEDIRRIKSLAPAHLRANFRLSHPSYLGELDKAVSEARLLGLPLEVALIVPDGEEALIDFARAWKESGGKAVRWLVFSESKDSTPPGLLEAAVRRLSPLMPGAEFAPGSKGDFVLLNRGRPPASEHGIAYGMTPQVHLSDNRTLVESLQGQEWILRTAEALWPRQKAIVTPVTLKRAPLASALKKPAGPLATDHWKTQVDARQFSLLGAGWTLGSLKRMALNSPIAGLSATYYETTGLLGVLAGALPADSLAVPGTDFRLDGRWVYPLFHVFADFSEFRGGTVHDLDSQAPMRFDAIRLNHGGRSAILVANLEEVSGSIRLEGVAKIKGIRRLNEKNAFHAMEDPEGYRGMTWEPHPLSENGLLLDLLPFEVVRIELG